MTSPPQPDRGDAVGTAQWLGSALNGLSERLDAVREDSEARDEALTDYGRANRHRIWVTYALLFVDIGLTVVVAVFAGQAHSAALAANQTRQASAASCASGNGLRQTLDQVFDHVFDSFTPPAADTPAQKAAGIAKLKALEAYYHANFAAKNCTAIYGVTPVTPVVKTPVKGKAR